MKIQIGFSPCPNDTFIFDALLHGKIDTEGLEFEAILADVESLNNMAFEGKLNFTKLSFGTFAQVQDKYLLLNSGAALGRGCGPMLIYKNDFEEKNLSTLIIGIPGKHTTANFLCNMAFPQAQNKKEMLFSDIENALLKDEIDLGLIIHESRFTYQEKGLKKFMDLGDYWENQTASPIPLGGIFAKNTLAIQTIVQVEKLIKKSIEFAFANPNSSMDYVLKHSQGMSREVVKKHIDLYVNNFSLELGEEGKLAVEQLLELIDGSRLNLGPINKKV